MAEKHIVFDLAGHVQAYMAKEPLSSESQTPWSELTSPTQHYFFFFCNFCAFWVIDVKHHSFRLSTLINLTPI